MQIDAAAYPALAEFLATRTSRAQIASHEQARQLETMVDDVVESENFTKRPGVPYTPSDLEGDLDHVVTLFCRQLRMTKTEAGALILALFPGRRYPEFVCTEEELAEMDEALRAELHGYHVELSRRPDTVLLPNEPSLYTFLFVIEAAGIATSARCAELRAQLQPRMEVAF